MATLHSHCALAVFAGLAVGAMFSSSTLADEQLVHTIAAVKPSIVGIGTYSAVRRPPAQLLGTGFAVDDGRHAVTNFHVIDVELDQSKKESLVIFVGTGREVDYRAATIVARDSTHDLALLSFGGAALPILELARNDDVSEGTSVAFTGFPIGAVLGLHPVTHRGIVSAITPIAIPMDHARQLTADQISALRDPYDVLQLDATAYPGNSGSPVYLPGNGAVIGVVNQVFVKGKKENILRDPSAITYAIPVRYLRPLLTAR